MEIELHSVNISNLYIDQDRLENVVGLMRGRGQTIKEIAALCAPFYSDYRWKMNTELLEKYLTDQVKPILTQLKWEFAYNDWCEETIKQIIQDKVKITGLKFPQIANALRIIVFGMVDNMPSISKTLELMEQKETIRRLAEYC